MARFFPSHPFYETAVRPFAGSLSHASTELPSLWSSDHGDKAKIVDRPLWDQNDQLPGHTRPQLTHEEAQLLNDYSSAGNVFGHLDDYYKLNSRLRDPRTPLGDWYSEAHEKLKGVFAKAPRMETPVRVFRRISLPDSHAGTVHQQVFDKLRGLVHSGRTIRLPGYQSTSTDRHQWFGSTMNDESNPRSIGLLIKAHHGIDMTPYSGYREEKELLLPHNSKFRVLGIQSRDELRKRGNTAPMPRYMASLEQVV